jgi:uncharacterized RDD family membrane protein YckC
MIEGLARDSDTTRYAGFWIRVFANVLDLLMLGAVNQALLLATGGWRVFGGGGEGASIGAVWISIGSSQAVVAGILPPVVIIGSWIALGASPGKLICGLRIVDEPTGGRPSTWQCIARYFMALVALACAGIGYFYIAIDPRKQGWHDKIVRTLVVHRQRAS